jgi:hypothetical protein
MKNGENKKYADEERKNASILVALRTGLLRKCVDHGEVFDPGQHDFQGACMVATYLINNSDPLVAPFLGDRALLMEQLRAICKLYGSACTLCARPTPV